MTKNGRGGVGKGAPATAMTAELRAQLLRMAPPKNDDSRAAHLLPWLTLGIGSRVALTAHVCKPLGLLKGATGTLVGVVYEDNASAGPIMPGADVERAAASVAQPQAHVALVKQTRASAHSARLPPRPSGGSRWSG